MTHEEEVLLEQYYQYINMDKTSRNFYINLILNSKELTNSEFNLRSDSPSSYDLVILRLNNEGCIVTFECAISNGEENKFINGIISRKRNNYSIYMFVHRLNDLVSTSLKDYHVTDKFVFNNNTVLRKSSYSNQKYFETNIVLKTDEEMESYYRSKIGKQIKKID